MTAKIMDVRVSDLLNTTYINSYGGLKYPELILSEAIDIIAEEGRSWGYGDKYLIELIFDNQYSVTFAMDDEFLDKQFVLICNEKEELVRRDEVHWLTDEPVNMVNRLAVYFHEYGYPITNLHDYNSHDYFISHDYQKRFEPTEEFKALVEDFMNRP